MSSERRFLYQSNDVPYKLMLLVMVLNTYYTIIYLKALTTTFKVGSFIIANITFLLIGFLCSAKINVYNKIWTIIGVILGIIQFFRLFVTPEYMSKSTVININVTLILSIVLVIISCFMTFKRIAIIKKLKGV